MKVRIMGGPVGPLLRPLTSVNQGRIVLGGATPSNQLVFDTKGSAVSTPFSFTARLHQDDLKQVLRLLYQNNEERDDLAERDAHEGVVPDGRGREEEPSPGPREEGEAPAVVPAVDEDPGSVRQEDGEADPRGDAERAPSDGEGPSDREARDDVLQPPTGGAESPLAEDRRTAERARERSRRALEEAIARAKTTKPPDDPPPVKTKPGRKKRVEAVDKEPKFYNVRMLVGVGDIVVHPSFENGTVEWVREDKMCVKFEDKSRVLVCGGKVPS